MRYTLPYGTGSLSFELPATMRAHLACSRSLPPLADLEAAVCAALRNPVGAPPLAELAKPGMRVVIAFTDATRACPDRALIEPLLAELKACGVRDADATLLCAVGMHRASTPAEKLAKLGPDLLRRCRVVDHDARDAAGLVDLGLSASGVPLSVSRLAYEADLLIATGVVEPHQYAGYSGGAKTLSVGAAGEAMIAYTHGPAMLELPGTRLGRIMGNPFREAVNEAGRRAGLRLVVNVVLDEDQQVVALRAGDPLAAFEELVAVARGLYEAPIPQQFDAAIGGVGYPKDANLYQATRGASYLYFAPLPVLRLGGLIVLPARCQEGAGEGVGEQRFFEAMRAAPDVQTIVETARREGYPPGQQRAFIMAKVLSDVEVVIVGADDPELVRACKLTPLPDMAAAIAYIERRCGSQARVLVVPHCLLTLPVVEQE
jgi:nickel-dependent lactate racemase